MPAGSLIVESLADPSVLEHLKIEARRTIEARSATGAPRVWTIVEFGLGGASPMTVAAALGAALRDGPCYVDFTDGERVYVVFSDQVFDYRRGDAAAHAEAVAHAVSKGIPAVQLDWNWRS